MNRDNDKQTATDIDPQVSDQYTSLADEKTPVDLDRAVLREATRAARTDNRKGSFGAWFRPVAFVAMVGLSLAIILDLSNTSIFDPAADMSFESAPSAPVEAPARNGTDATARNRSQTTFSEFKRQEKAAASQQAPTADTPDATRDDDGYSSGESASPAAITQPRQPSSSKLLRMQSDPAPADTRPAAETLEDNAEASEVFTVEAESAEQRVQKLEANVRAKLPSQTGTAAQLPAVSLSQVAPFACSDEQKSAVEAWWNCVITLRQSGQAEAADSELEKLRKSFPDFTPPE